MENSAFNLKTQQTDLTSKIVVGLERVSEAFKVLLWEHAKAIGLSPIQIQILIFLAYHKQNYCNVSHLAQEFNVTKPTISDAVKALDTKQLITKEYSSSDSRSYTITLSEKGKNTVSKTENFAKPIQNVLDQTTIENLEVMYKAITDLIFGLNKSGNLSVQRMCFSCKFYDKTEDRHFCNFLNKPLQTNQIRVDCPEFEPTT